MPQQPNDRKFNEIVNFFRVSASIMIQVKDWVKPHLPDDYIIMIDGSYLNINITNGIDQVVIGYGVRNISISGYYGPSIITNMKFARTMKIIELGDPEQFNQENVIKVILAEIRPDIPARNMP